jgi:hypothetical protein
MRNPKFKSIHPNYKKNVLEIALLEGRKVSNYSLPFAVFRGHEIGSKNRFKKILIDSELNSQGVSFVLENGTKGDFPADLVLYYCDPAYDWSPLNQLKKNLKNKLKGSGLSLRVLADALSTSPAQVVRLLEENKGAKQLAQLFQIAELAGYHVEFQLKKKLAA